MAFALSQSLRLDFGLRAQGLQVGVCFKALRLLVSGN